MRVSGDPILCEVWRSQCVETVTRRTGHMSPEPLTTAETAQRIINTLHVNLIAVILFEINPAVSVSLTDLFQLVLTYN